MPRAVANPTRFLFVAAQLALVLWTLRVYHVENLTGMGMLAPWIFGGFVVHALLPLRWRMPFFLLLSLVSIGLILGVGQGAGLVAVGLGLIGICHLPFSFRVRVLLLVLAGALLAGVRAEWLVLPWDGLPNVVLPVLAGMFMWRLAIYVYDLRNERQPVGLSTRLAYFFMVPNVCFPLFPQVDYSTFCRTHYGRDANDIYQKGVTFVLRGVLHLLIYRVVYYYLVPAPSDVTGLGSLVQSMVATYGLFIRVSGQFHLVIGTLCLFGFDLQRPTNLYFLSSSVSDFWRRAAPYWKDFMQKLLFYPVYVRLRKLGVVPGLVIATIAVFIATTLLHSYQWFWLRGGFPLRIQDGLFWSVLGVFVIVNTIQQVKRPKKGSPTSFGARLRLSLNTVGVFALLCVMWSIWSAGTFPQWLGMVGQAGNSPASDWLLLALGTGGLVLAGAVIPMARARFVPPGVDAFFGGPVSGLLIVLVLLLLGHPATRPDVSGTAGEVLESIATERLSPEDKVLQQRGYYEGLLGQERFASGLWRLAIQKPKDWVATYNSAAVRDVDGLLEFEFIPSRVTPYKGKKFTTNQWGMHDREYSLEKPAGTYRIALLGGSILEGAGIEDDEGAEVLLEDMMNRELAGRGHDAFEVLNFSVGAYSVLQNLVVVDEKIPRFDPDAVVVMVFSTEYVRLTANLVRAVQSWDHDFNYAFVRDVVERAGARQDMLWEDLDRRFQPFLDELIASALHTIADSVRASGSIPVLCFSRHAGDTEPVDHWALKYRRLASEAGFVFLDMSDLYGEISDLTSLHIAPWDVHPNPRGHALLADALFRQLEKNAAALGL